MGHLFQGRYKAVVVQTDAHLRRTVRYLIRNPIRAGLSSRPEQWRWTSHRATAGRSAVGVVAVDELLACFADEREEALRLYRVMVGSPVDPPPARHPLVAGDDVFVVERLACVPRDPEFTQAMVRPPRPTLASVVCSVDDREGIATAHLGHGYSLRQIATHLGCSVTTVHRRVHDRDERHGSLQTAAAGGTKKT